jgi:hypothetical protein
MSSRLWLTQLGEICGDGPILRSPYEAALRPQFLLMITRDAERYRAKFVCRCSFVPSIGGSTVVNEAALREAFAKPNMDRVSALHFGDGARRDDAWLVGDNWWLSASSTRQ